MRNAVEIILTTGKRVVLAPLTLAEQVKAVRASGKGDGLAAKSEVTLTAARMSVREIDGAPVGFVKLLGAQWDKCFTMRETMQVLHQVGTMHSPPESAYQAAKDGATMGAAGTTYTLPDGSVVVLRELAYGQVQQGFALADKEPSPVAVEYMIALAGVKASIVSINGTAPTWPADGWIEAWPFDVPNTVLLMALWRDLHGFDDARPTVVPTTA